MWLKKLNSAKQGLAGQLGFQEATYIASREKRRRLLEELRLTQPLYVALFDVLCVNKFHAVKLEELRDQVQRTLSAKYPPEQLNKALPTLLTFLEKNCLGVIRITGQGQLFCLTPGIKSKEYFYYTIDKYWVAKQRNDNIPLPQPTVVDMQEEKVNTYTTPLEGKDLVAETNEKLKNAGVGVIYRLTAEDDNDFVLLVTPNRLDLVIPQLKKIIRNCLVDNQNLLDEILTRQKKGFDAKTRNLFNTQLKQDDDTFWLQMLEQLNSALSTLAGKKNYRYLEENRVSPVVQILISYAKGFLEWQTTKERELKMVQALVKKVTDLITRNNIPYTKKNVLETVREKLKDREDLQDLFQQELNKYVHPQNNEFPLIFELGDWLVPAQTFGKLFDKYVVETQRELKNYYSSLMDKALHGRYVPGFDSERAFEEDIVRQLNMRNKRFITQLLTDKKLSPLVQMMLKLSATAGFSDLNPNDYYREEAGKFVPQSLQFIFDLNLAVIANEARQALSPFLRLRLWWYGIFLPKVPVYMRLAIWNQRKKSSQKTREQVTPSTIKTTKQIIKTSRKKIHILTPEEWAEKGNIIKNSPDDYLSRRR